MKNNKFRIISDKGITLIALIVTISVMIIIISISVYTGKDTLDNTRLQEFYTELGIIQKRVDDIVTTNEEYVDYYGISKPLKNLGTTKVLGEMLNIDSVREDLKEVFGYYVDLPLVEFKYFKASELEEFFDLKNMKYNVYVHFETRTIVSEQGVSVNGTTYHVLKNQLYFPNQNNEKNKTEDLEYTASGYGTKYRIKVTPITTGDLIANGTLQYKKSTSKYWETVDGLDIIVSELTKYDIKYTDNNKHTISETIKVSLNSEGKPSIEIIKDNNKSEV